MSLLLALACAAPDLLVVDQQGGPGADFTALEVAIDAAADGDILLVRSGSYSVPPQPFSGPGPFEIDGKGLTLVEAPGGTVTVNGLVVRNLLADQSVVVRGIDLELGAVLSGDDCEGPIWVEDLHADLASGSDQVGVGLRFGNCDRAHLSWVTVGCTGTPLIALNAALEVDDSRVFAHQCDLTGCLPSGLGSPQPAVRLLSEGFFSGCTLSGACTAVDLLLAPTAAATALDTELVESTVCGATTTPGVGGLGSYAELTGDARTLAMDAVAVPGTDLGASLGGLAGDFVWLRIAASSAVLDFPLFTGVFQLSLGGPGGFLFQGTLPGSGELDLAFPVGPIANPATLYAQAAHLKSGTVEVVLGNPSVFVVAP